MEQSKTDPSNFNIEKALDIFLHLGLIFLVIGLCLYFIMPFSLVLIWGAIIAVSVFPSYNRLLKLFKGHKIAATVVVVFVLLSMVVVPSWLLTDSMIKGVGHFRDSYREGLPLIPPPGQTVQQWPAFSKPVIDLWQHASTDLQGLLIQHKAQLTELGAWLLLAISGFGKGVIQFLISIIIAAVFLVFSDPLSKSTLKIFNKITPGNAGEITTLTVSTIRSVVKGILGVAAIQAAMAGIAFGIVGVPYAGLWTIFCLMLSIVQIGSWPVLLVACVYVFSVNDTLTASLFAAWMIVVVMTDNFLTPIFLGRGSSVPMLVVFMGAIGGFIAIGFLGLFLGAVVLSIGYKLSAVWLNSGTQDDL